MSSRQLIFSPSSNSLDRWSWPRAALVGFLIVLGFSMRFVFAFLWGSHPFSGREGLYVQIGTEWVESFRFTLDDEPTAIVMPLYPVLLGLSRWLFPHTWAPVYIIQAFSGALTAWFAYRIAWRISRIPAVAWAVLVLVLFYPPLILLSLKLQPLSLLCFFLALALWTLTSTFRESFQIVHFMAAALSFSISLYISPKLAPLVPFIAFWSGIRCKHRSLGLLGAVAICLASLVALMPWAARNFLVLGDFIPLTTGMVFSLEDSLTEAAPSDNQAIENRGDRRELLRYQESIRTTSGLAGEIPARKWFSLLYRILPFWVTDYGDLLSSLPNSGDTETWLSGKRGLFVRATAMTGSVVFLLFALVGGIVFIRNLDGWLLLGTLGLGSAVSALFHLPSYDHLLYWPYLAFFAAWGGYWTIGLFLDRAASDEPMPSSSLPPGDTPSTSSEPGRLEPIRGSRKPTAESSKGASNERSDRIGPLF